MQHLLRKHEALVKTGMVLVYLLVMAGALIRLT